MPRLALPNIGDGGEEITDSDNLKAMNTAVDSLEDNASVALAQAAPAGIALAQLNRHREGTRSVTHEAAFALSVGAKYASPPPRR
ncbi:hypothetical protein BS329_30020 [Amycolatopsis coloradensis]|uniref:Uncharacterized protein n=1 Tax=Amycolatopsis coloradensis TaxID=76021 RepID=A0A1R0KK17_9PSEU|nr:hypothetical protein [Amycolatopsis coloradensis]OLZ46474.1 hypothetical protein BS329_30020 [Amycolatopsis coloradensis]